ncbi:MAG: DUF177 domain-containing protein [Clostridiaceae bacterium]|nr:DUF177 domain-containing protein [Eubacteriales bacterium]
MKLNVAEQLKLAGKAKHAELEAELGPFFYGGRTVAFASPVRMHVDYVYDGDCFQVSGRLETELASECALCGKAFAEPFGFSFSERFKKDTSEEDDAYEYRGEELDLGRMAEELIFLNLPLSSVCAEDCKGLCPVCGCNLNTAQCSCAGDGLINPFLTLGALRNVDKEV